MLFSVTGISLSRACSYLIVNPYLCAGFPTVPNRSRGAHRSNEAIHVREVQLSEILKCLSASVKKKGAVRAVLLVGYLGCAMLVGRGLDLFSNSCFFMFHLSLEAFVENKKGYFDFETKNDHDHLLLVKLAYGLFRLSRLARISSHTT